METASKTLKDVEKLSAGVGGEGSGSMLSFIEESVVRRGFLAGGAGGYSELEPGAEVGEITRGAREPRLDILERKEFFERCEDIWEVYDACRDAPGVIGALLIDDASSSAGVCTDDIADDGRETIELAADFSVDAALDFLVEFPSDHLPNALLSRFAGFSPLPRNVGDSVGLSRLRLSDIIDTTIVEASL